MFLPLASAFDVPSDTETPSLITHPMISYLFCFCFYFSSMLNSKWFDSRDSLGYFRIFFKLLEAMQVETFGYFDVI